MARVVLAMAAKNSSEQSASAMPAAVAQASARRMLGDRHADARPARPLAALGQPRARHRHHCGAHKHHKTAGIGRHRRDACRRPKKEAPRAPDGRR